MASLRSLSVAAPTREPQLRWALALGRSRASIPAVHVTFAAGELERAYRESAYGARRWGTAVARKYVQRIHLLLAAEDLRDLAEPASLRLHSLKGEYSGAYAISLGERWRLIFRYDGRSRRFSR